MPDETACRLAKPIGDLPSNFILDSATYERGNELGFDGLDFYVCGRAGVLGPVASRVASAVLVFCNPVMVRERWERGRKVMEPGEAASEFASCLYRWSLSHLASDVDYERLSQLLGRIVSAASTAGAPLFAGWLSLPEPQEPVVLAMHRMNALRELRGALHAAAVLTAGLDPMIAVLVKTPFMAGVFGWEGPLPDVCLAKDAWLRAEQQTDRAMARVMAALGEKEQLELLSLLEEVHAGVH